MPGNRARGAQRAQFPLRPGLQAMVARDMARVLRSEYAMGYPPIQMIRGLRPIPRDEAARRMDEQADRWETEIQTGVPNTFDRERIGY